MCQPMNGLVERQDDPERKYHDILVYNRPLTAKELRDYELDRLFTYQDVSAARQAEFNELPIWWAFGQKQFDEQMTAHGLRPNETDKLYSFPGGGFYKKEDAQIIRDFFNRKDIITELMKDPAFAEEAFYYEMANHEYHINWQGDWDVCSCFGNVEYKEGAGGLYYLTELGYGDEIKTAYRRAADKFFADAAEEEWI